MNITIAVALIVLAVLVVAYVIKKNARLES